MKIAVASGKGGTGKTTVATNLAWLAAQAGANAAYVDCDAEEPNGHLFLKPVLETQQPVMKVVPQVDARRCTNCGACAQFCQFHAIVCLGSGVLVYPELCHGCGGCRLVCPQNAIGEHEQEIGRVASGRADQLRFVEGRLGVGEAQSPPVIRAAKAAVPAADLVFLDAPPGNSCPVVETTRGSDLVLIVTEPTPFGLHDLRLALDLARRLHLRCGVVINRALVGQPEARQLCQRADIPVFAEIPDNMAVAEACSEGHLAVEKVPGLQRRFAQMLLRIAPPGGTDILPKRVRKNLEDWAKPGGEGAAPTLRAPKTSPPAFCYLALRKRPAQPGRHRASSSPGS